MSIAIPPDLIERMGTAERVVVLTGSGVSAESGVPTFRDAQTGLWARFRPEDLATPEAFDKDPTLVWRWYKWRRELVAGATPNPAHDALVELERRCADFVLVTQNVDGLHQRAGSRTVIEFHGNILRTKCSAEGTLVERWDNEQIPPRCSACGALLRPDVVWFGESIPTTALARSFGAAERAELFLSIGTSSIVYPAAGLAAAASSNGASLIEVNPNPTPLSDYADYTLRGPAGAILPALVNALARG